MCVFQCVVLEVPVVVLLLFVFPLCCILSFSPLFRRLALCTIVEPREFNITEDANGFLVLDNERDTEQRRRIIHRNCSIGAHILTHVDAGIGIWGKAALLFFLVFLSFLLFHLPDGRIMLLWFYPRVFNTTAGDVGYMIRVETRDTVQCRRSIHISCRCVLHILAQLSV